MNATMTVKDTSGQLKRWFEHVGNLFKVSATPSSPQHDPPRVRRITRVKTEAPSVQEVETVIRSPGAVFDRISAEMLKADPVVVSTQLLHQLFCNIWDTAIFPADFS